MWIFIFQAFSEGNEFAYAIYKLFTKWAVNVVVYS